MLTDKVLLITGGTGSLIPTWLKYEFLVVTKKNKMIYADDLIIQKLSFI